MGITKADTVKLISAEGFEFVIHKEAAMISNTLKNMLSSSGGFQETELGEVRFPEISTPILEKLCQFFYYKLRYTNSAAVKNVPEFKIEPEIAIELLMASNFLDC
ncbi:transcription elongation factor B, polypeptide 1 [Klebsormidium nitens]|uniref:Elongin-C n=1 Tax=Klebsormidium nitens TaxID=105231 RepID=A0A1Y1IDM0_KLENI|nr:transcription elongation factor B, polypeptide 1 [Klebsormidium nitens]|eukprot:TRINITY_DN16799_c0_g1_i1.p1 TRINITY_DN16799_c0_g1~~TRINITY_DN16799_c0_g1_i1.p1  ORF type:complete len:105 (-),score=15.75 TRINITY_DN16799_c0_g1_i1:185-499(-)